MPTNLTRGGAPRPYGGAVGAKPRFGGAVPKPLGGTTVPSPSRESESTVRCLSSVGAVARPVRSEGLRPRRGVWSHSRTRQYLPRQKLPRPIHAPGILPGGNATPRATAVGGACSLRSPDALDAAALRSCTRAGLRSGPTAVTAARRGAALRGERRRDDITPPPRVDFCVRAVQRGAAPLRLRWRDRGHRGRAVQLTDC